MKVSVILPSLNPDDKLMMVVKGLIDKGFDDIIIVNDGSDEEHMEPFRKAAEFSQVTILTHDVNRGKGRGLKTAFEYCLANRKDIDGIVTVDGDNQHRPDDIFKCCEAMVAKNAVILGCRNFTGNNVPPKSKIGNNITRFVFRFVCGIRISDTQTGLRAIPYRYLELMSQIRGERFEYETQMLLEMKNNNIPFYEEQIETVYIEENSSTHFHPIRDSIKIYGVIFKYLFSSMLSFAVDMGLFTAIVYIIGHRLEPEFKILIATVGARIVSSFINYNFNRKAVFESKASVSKSMPRYYILCLCQTALSYLLVYILSDIMRVENIFSSLIKMVVDICLFIISFQFQRRWVFVNSKSK